MIAPNAISIWQAFAQSFGSVSGGFAMSGGALHCCLARLWRNSLGACNCSSTLTPSLRSGPSLAGPVLPGRRVVADIGKQDEDCFETHEIAEEAAWTTAVLRGGLTRPSRLASSSVFQCRRPAACTVPRRAGWTALHPVASRSACRPAIRVTERAAFWRITPTSRTIRPDRPVGPFVFARF
jgi:hypothetical protein